MGFSVSGATVVLFLGIVISFGVAYSAASNGAEVVTDAYHDSTDKDLTRQNTAISITHAAVANDGLLNVTVENTGSSTLSVSDTDILINGSYRVHSNMEPEPLEVDGNETTDLWLPGETLHFESAHNESPARVKVVTESGVSAAALAEYEEVA